MTGGPLKVYTIPSSLPFGRSLAAGLLERSQGNPEALSRMLILLPTRRACRALREIFLDLTDGRPLLLPRMKPLGDVDAEELSLGWPDLEDMPEALDIPPALPPLRRRIMLARAVLARDKSVSGWEEAMVLADTLGRFLDQMIIEEREFSGLSALVPQDYADHWQITLKFLEILTQVWPDILAGQGCIDAAYRRRLLMDRQAQSWRAAPPAYPVIAAGSTGSIPATARLLKVIAALPQGAVILPGFDTGLDEESWNALDPSHPQFGFKQLCARLDMERHGVSLWPDIATQAGQGTGREILAREIMRPAATSQHWMTLAGQAEDRAAIEKSLENLHVIECASPREEAGVVALALREALEQPGRTAALVTPDRKLAIAVSQQCGRWGVELDDSAGMPLSSSDPGRFLILLLEAAESGLRPAPLLALLRHPLCRVEGGLSSLLEMNLLRGPRPQRGLAGLEGRFMHWKAENQKRGLQAAEAEAALAGLLGFIGPILEPLLRLMDSTKTLSLHDYIAAHISSAEALARPDALWQGDEGEALSTLIAQMLAEAAVVDALGADDYKGLFTSVLSGASIRPRYGTHPRLMILGQLEARLIHADTVILAGLNEGTWPPDPGHDPWMSRPMRRALGLPDADRAIGLAAHDFTQGLSAGRVLITRAVKKDGAPTVPARWLQRFETVLRASGIDGAIIKNDAYRLWFQDIDKSDEIQSTDRPCPRPPVAARPQELSVTAIQAWVEDPYQIYARNVLKLKALEPLEKPVDAAGRGDLLHGVLEDFIKVHPHDLPPDAHDIILRLAQKRIAAEQIDAAALSFWWPRLEALSRWFLKQEAEWRRRARPLGQEAKGEWNFITAQGHHFTLTGRADRVDRLLAEPSYAIIDYKTGGDYSKSEIASGKRPQLGLEALMLQEGGFSDYPPGPVSALAYWVMKGGAMAGECVELSEQIGAVSERARALLEELVDRYARPETGYPVQPDPARTPRFNDYEHLSRLKEWGEGEEAEIMAEGGEA